MSPRQVSAHGTGKLILVGEHAVVHGQPAIAFAVDRGTTVTLRAAEGPTRLRPDLQDTPLRDAICAVVGTSGVEVTLATDLPIGRGMGSSAALAVALARAWHAWSAPDAPPLAGDALFDAAMPTERAFHATPSGLDVAVSVHGGVLRYRRGPPLSWRPLAPPTWSVVVLDSGTAGPTGPLVAGVTARRPAIDPLLDRIGGLVDAAEGALHDPATLGPILDENHALLRDIGVSTPALDGLCALARRAGAHGAKLSGAGGGGVVIALVTDPEPVLAAARVAGVPAFTARPAPAAAPSPGSQP